MPVWSYEHVFYFPQRGGVLFALQCYGLELHIVFLCCGGEEVRGCVFWRWRGGQERDEGIILPVQVEYRSLILKKYMRRPTPRVRARDVRARYERRGRGV